MIEKKYTGIAKQGADVVANPTLDGSEQALNSIRINGENFKIASGGGSKEETTEFRANMVWYFEHYENSQDGYVVVESDPAAQYLENKYEYVDVGEIEELMNGLVQGVEGIRFDIYTRNYKNYKLQLDFSNVPRTKSIQWFGVMLPSENRVAINSNKFVSQAFINYEEDMNYVEFLEEVERVLIEFDEFGLVKITAYGYEEI